MLSVRSTAYHRFAVGSTSGETNGGNALRSQMASTPLTRKHMPVKRVKPRLTSPRRWTHKSAIVPPTAASKRRKKAACGRACTLRGGDALADLVGSVVVVLQAD